jgi:NADH-quinone oxidoreductase subunit M
MDPGTANTTLPLISVLIFTLVIGASLIWVIPSHAHAKWVALATVIVDLIVAVFIVIGFDPSNPQFQFIETSRWIETLAIQYKVGVDGVNVLFLPLTIVLFLGVLVSSWNSVQTMPRLYYTLLLLLESTIVGVFCALDTILFFLFWELTLIPLYFLISLWGIGANRRYAAVKYTMFMLVGGVPLLFGFLLLAFNHADVTASAVPQGLSFDYVELLHVQVSDELQLVVFLLLLTGFAVKTPVFPLHTWLPVVSMEGPAAIAALMTGLKLGAYGIIRFVVPLAPQAAVDMHWLLAGLGVVGILYGAVAAIHQTNIRRMLAYASISHVGLVLLGLASYNLQGIQGAVFQLLNFTVIAGGIFLLTGSLQQRIGSTDIISLGGAAHSMPLLASFFFLFGLAGLGIPLTSGFPAELLLITSALQTHTGAGLAALFGIVLSAAYFLRIYRRAFFGPVKNTVVSEAMDLHKRELLTTSVIAVFILLAGLFPSLILNITKAASMQWVERLTQL